jgi:hypothetical protein
VGEVLTRPSQVLSKVNHALLGLLSKCLAEGKDQGVALLVVVKGGLNSWCKLARFQ